MMGKIRADRETRADAARGIAATLLPGDYYADGGDCVDRISGKRVYCGTHWDACLVMLAAPKA